MTRVLVVDDMAAITDLLAAALRREGYQVVTAATGGEALTVMKSQVLDAVVLDLGLPDMDGLDVVRAARKTPSGCPPVVLLTASAERERVLEAAELGLSQYVLKGQFSLGGLLRRIDAAIHPRTARVRRAQRAGPAESGVADGASGEVGGETGGGAGQSPLSQQAREADAVSGRALALETLRRTRPIMTRSATRERLESGEDPEALPPTIAEIMKLTASTNSSLDQLVGVVRKDPAVALAVLKLANSTAYSRRGPAESIDKAVVRLGLDGLRHAAIGMGVVQRFSPEDEPQRRRLARFWQHSIACGLINAELASAAERDPGAALTAGLLHDVGQLALRRALGADYDAVTETASELHLPLETVESRLLGHDHAAAAEALLRAWRIPKDLIDPIVLHHADLPEIRKRGRDRWEEAASLALADRIAQAILLGGDGREMLRPLGELCEALSVDPGQIEALAQRIPDQADDIRLAMMAGWSPEALRTPDERGRTDPDRPLRPLFIGASPGTDPVRLLCARLAGPAGSLDSAADGPPNVAVVHIADGREEAALIAMLTAEEQALGAAGLPLVVVSRDGRSTAAEEGGRRVEHVPMPFQLARFVGAIERAAA